MILRHLWLSGEVYELLHNARCSEIQGEEVTWKRSAHQGSGLTEGRGRELARETHDDECPQRPVLGDCVHDNGPSSEETDQ